MVWFIVAALWIVSGIFGWAWLNFIINGSEKGVSVSKGHGKKMHLGFEFFSSIFFGPIALLSSMLLAMNDRCGIGFNFKL